MLASNLRDRGALGLEPSSEVFDGLNVHLYRSSHVSPSAQICGKGLENYGEVAGRHSAAGKHLLENLVEHSRAEEAPYFQYTVDGRSTRLLSSFFPAEDFLES